MLRPPDAGTFEHLLTLVPVPATGMLRLSISGSSEPYWAKKARYRFDDPWIDPALAPGEDPSVSRFGVVYVAPKLSTTFAESVVHENSLFRNGAFEVPVDDIEKRDLTWLEHPSKSELQLVDLTGSALKRLGLNADLTAGSDYTMSQEWSRAIYLAQPSADGLLYASRQRPGEFCYALFQRSGVQRKAWRKLSDAEKVALCDEFNVVPV